MTDSCAFGLDSDVEQAFAQLEESDLKLGRVLTDHGGLLRVALDAGGETLARISGRLRRSDTSVTVGDWVAVQGSSSRTTIMAVLPRRSVVQRTVPGRRTQVQVLAANVNTALLMMGLDSNYSPRRVDRFLAMLLGGGVEPVIVLNKVDLCSESVQRQSDLRQRCPGVPVLTISATLGHGVDGLYDYLKPGRTVVVLGSSGVGKSTLTNRLLGVEQQRTAEVRCHDSHGRHTTSSRELMTLPCGAMLIDTPGLREVRLWDSDGTAIDAAFSTITGLAAQCRFLDCRHQREPGCTVRAAVEGGRIDIEELASWQKLHLERLQAMRDDKRRSPAVPRSLRPHSNSR